MSPRGKRNVRIHQRLRDQQRQELEERWDEEIEERHDLAKLCMAKTARAEPFHRWLSYRQGFAPELVRRFLAEAAPVAGPLLDPFNGSGTFTTECAREGRFALGVEAGPGLAVVSGAPWSLPPPAWPDGTSGDLPALWKTAEHPSQRALLLLAAAGSVDGEGHAKRDQPPLHEALSELGAVVAEDLASPLESARGVLRGDARRLPLADGVVGGGLTSPPYVSRYDYTRVQAPLDRLLGQGRRKGRRSQMKASRTTAGRPTPEAPHPAGEEAAQQLADEGREREAHLARGYFHDLDRVLGELARVCAPGAPIWIVIGGADLKRVYIPSDLIAAELAEGQGFEVEHLWWARDLKPRGHRLGTRNNVRPRETVVVLRRAAAEP